MESVIDKICYCFLLLQLISSAHGMKCYHCQSNQSDDSCERGLPSISSRECTSGEVCVTYKYDVFLNGHKAGTTTIRGCEKNKNYCGSIEDLINILVTPAVVKERQCYICERDLCNSASSIYLSPLVVISLSVTFLILT
ncbi:uncharacterized protein LOC123682636 [Harmonia axyridis]|uniref:uncharacterized protein LOC123682636 n=1 Tax=Harmonia axyridis TaxID=115357 RepID=UPI001E277918|nr:uncharacterized protein LOC123682636 [Harmonia axyridis]